MKCHTFLRNIRDLLSDGKTPNERRFGQPFKGPMIPFGSLVEYCPISAKDQSRIHQFGKKVLLGLFLGHVLFAGKIWKGDILVADIEELENMDASEIHPRRINAKEVLTPRRREYFIFPIADGSAKLSGRDHEFREPTLRREQPVWSEDLSGELQGETEGPQPTESNDDAEARKDFRSIQGDFICQHHIEPQVKLKVPKEESFPIPLKYIDVTRATYANLDVLQEKRIHLHVLKEETFPIPLKKIDVTRTTHTNLDVLQESRIDDYWNFDVDRSLSDSWTGFTKFTILNEEPPEGYMWSRRRLAKVQVTTRPDHLWPEVRSSMSKAAQRKENQQWTVDKTKLDNAGKLRGIYCIGLDDGEFKETIDNARKKLEIPMEAVVPCKLRKTKRPNKLLETGSETKRSNKIQKPKQACIVEALESARQHLASTKRKDHEDHVAEKGFNSINHCNLFLCSQR